MSENEPQPPETRTRYGTAHPEEVENALWQKAIKEEWTGYRLKSFVRATAKKSDYDWDNIDFNQEFWRSSYRDATPGPYWSWERFGRTSTALPDGRVLHIAGEHEDSYDPDFCIYNDVVVQYPGGKREFYLYPKDVFPPTDFHTATLLGDEILLIGSLGYQDTRRPGENQVMKLNIKTLQFRPVVTFGEGPGWISKHITERLDETRLLVVGGEVQTEEDYVPNTDAFELDLTAMTWRRREHGDVEIFPISRTDYDALKNPQFGSANPERSDNPFWLAMLKRQWSPSRARLHFGDFAPPEPELVFSDQHDDFEKEPPEYGTPEHDAWMQQLSADVQRSKLVRKREDIVWTAEREEVLKIELADGRQLMIGGEVPDYGDEYADPWCYNDVLVKGRDGLSEIYTYPEEMFPTLIGAVGSERGDNVIIVSTLDARRYPDRSRTIVLRLNKQSYAIDEIAVEPPEAWVYSPDLDMADEGRLVFPVMREDENDPELAVEFDLDTSTWTPTFEHPYPRYDDD